MVLAQHMGWGELSLWWLPWILGYFYLLWLGSKMRQKRKEKKRS